MLQTTSRFLKILLALHAATCSSPLPQPRPNIASQPLSDALGQKCPVPQPRPNVASEPPSDALGQKGPGSSNELKKSDPISPRILTTAKTGSCAQNKMQVSSSQIAIRPQRRNLNTEGIQLENILNDVIPYSVTFEKKKISISVHFLSECALLEDELQTLEESQVSEKHRRRQRITEQLSKKMYVLHLVSNAYKKNEMIAGQTHAEWMDTAVRKILQSHLKVKQHDKKTKFHLSGETFGVGQPIRFFTRLCCGFHSC